MYFYFLYPYLFIMCRYTFFFYMYIFIIYIFVLCIYIYLYIFLHVYFYYLYICIMYIYLFIYFFTCIFLLCIYLYIFFYMYIFIIYIYIYILFYMYIYWYCLWCFSVCLSSYVNYIFMMFSVHWAAAAQNKDVWRRRRGSRPQEDASVLRQPGGEGARAPERVGEGRRWREGRHQGGKHQHLVRWVSRTTVPTWETCEWDSVSHDALQERLWNSRTGPATGSTTRSLPSSSGGERGRSPCPPTTRRWRPASGRSGSQSYCSERDQLTAGRGTDNILH